MPAVTRRRLSVRLSEKYGDQRRHIRKTLWAYKQRSFGGRAKKELQLQRRLEDEDCGLVDGMKQLN